MSHTSARGEIRALVANEIKRVCMCEVGGAGHCCYLNKGAFEQLDLDLMA